MDYQLILNEILKEIAPFRYEGKSADYIPELAKVDPNQFGLHLQCFDGRGYNIGSSRTKFSIQSITKVFAVTLAFLLRGDEIWKRVDVEPSGAAFNSLIQLELENGYPRNPLINSGALVIIDILLEELKNPVQDYLNFVRKVSNNPSINYNISVFRSEQMTGFRNAAIVNLIKSFGNIKNDVKTVLDFYYMTCSIDMSCEELAQSFLFYANHGKLESGESILTSSQVKRMNALMQTCGFYDEAGEFTFKVGLPGKSGVGGGIVAILPQYYSVAVWSPRLNPKGNSVLGLKSLELLTTKTGYSIF